VNQLSQNVLNVFKSGNSYLSFYFIFKINETHMQSSSIIEVISFNHVAINRAESFETVTEY
jgi:hypothetical protein